MGVVYVTSCLSFVFESSRFWILKVLWFATLYFFSFQNDGVNIINLKKTWEKVKKSYFVLIKDVAIMAVIDDRVLNGWVDFYGNNKRGFSSLFSSDGMFLFFSDD